MRSFRPLRLEALEDRTVPSDMGTTVLSATTPAPIVASIGSTLATTSVVNAPVVTSIVISTDNATNTTTLTATPASTDSNGLAVTYTYQWFQNGNILAGHTNQSLNLTTLSAINAGDSFTVQVTPADAIITGATVTSAAATVATASPNSITINLPATTALLVPSGTTPNPTAATTTSGAFPNGLMNPDGTYETDNSSTPIVPTTPTDPTDGSTSGAFPNGFIIPVGTPVQM
jgi:hypothetical protein